MAPTVAVIAAGAMGSAVAARLTARGCTVLTNLDGRSQRSVERAKKAGAQIVSLREVVSRAEWILSIVPPDSAEAFAQEVFSIAKDLRGLHSARFADCNATSPATVKRIAAHAVENGMPFVDACIIGGPPRDGYDPTFYVSAEENGLIHDFGTLSTYGLKVNLLEGVGVSVGDASALKMSYAVRIWATRVVHGA